MYQNWYTDVSVVLHSGIDITWLAEFRHFGNFGISAISELPPSCSVCGKYQCGRFASLGGRPKNVYNLAALKLVLDYVFFASIYLYVHVCPAFAGRDCFAVGFRSSTAEEEESGFLFDG